MANDEKDSNFKILNFEHLVIKKDAFNQLFKKVAEETCEGRDMGSMMSLRDALFKEVEESSKKYFCIHLDEDVGRKAIRTYVTEKLNDEMALVFGKGGKQ